MKRPKIALIGGGAAILSAAYHLSSDFEVTIYEKGKRLGRKFLVAGKGGFNLSNELDGADLVEKYAPKDQMQPFLLAFGSDDTREWLKKIGIPTFVGSSGRIFPEKGLKPAAVLKAILDALEKKGVIIKTNHEFIGWSADESLLFTVDNEQVKIKADTAVFSLGGGSWSKTGANDKWLKIFSDAGVETVPFQPSNCGLNVNWEESFRTSHQGSPLKNISISFAGKTFKGEALITTYGLEGNIIYPLSAMWRAHHLEKGNTVYIDFKPNNTHEELLAKLGPEAAPKKYKSRLNLSKPVLELVKWSLSKEDYINSHRFIAQIKHFPLSIESMRNVEEAIYTTGGIPFRALSPTLELHSKPANYIIGEMVNWDAPTGGFLLQGCFSMGYIVAKELNKKHEGLLRADI